MDTYRGPLTSTGAVGTYWYDPGTGNVFWHEVHSGRTSNSLYWLPLSEFILFWMYATVDILMTWCAWFVAGAAFGLVVAMFTNGWLS